MIFRPWGKAVYIFIFLNIFAAAHAFATVTIALNAYNGNGTNSHTDGVGRGINLIATVRGTTNTAVTWTLSGAGSLSVTGSYTATYTAPATMSSNSNIVITAHASANSSVSASYSFQLQNPVPDIHYATGWPLPTDTTTNLVVVGQNFQPSTVFYVNGSAAQSTYQSSTQVTLKVWIPYNSYGSIQVGAKTPAPGGGTSPNLAVPIKPLVINLNAFDQNGTNTGTARLGLPVQFRANVTGSPDLGRTWAINWSIQGSGSINSNGTYIAPAAMPSSSAVTVVASLAANSQVRATYQLTFQNPLPVVNAASPTHLAPGTTKVVTLTGSGFVPGSKVLVNGTAVSTTFQSVKTLQASVPAGSSSRVLVTVQNPSPGGSTSQPYSLQVDSPASASATIGTTLGRYVQSNFIGLSHEWNDAQWFMGSSKNGVNPIYRQLVQNLINPGSRKFVIRVGGYSSDTSGYPTSDTVTPFAELTQALPVHFTLGVNLGANNPSLAQDQAYTYIKNMPGGTVDAIEIGNEPDKYAAYGWRSSTYSISNYLSQFAQWRNTILQAVPASTKFLGASWGSLGSLENGMVSFEAQELSRVPTFSQHNYAEYTEMQSYPDNYLLSNQAATQEAQAVSAYVELAHQQGQMFRIGEMNSIDNGGINGISNSFGSALWAIDSMFELANVGVDGVNWHGTSGCSYCAFTFSTLNVDGRVAYSLARVNPLYYGLLMFHMATVNTPRLLPVKLSAAANIKVWAVMDSSKIVHVVIINKDESFAGNISISLPGYDTAQVTKLVAPGFESATGVSLGGQTFDGSVDGKLVGSTDNITITPSNGTYSVPLQPTSAVMLTLKP